MGLFHAIMDKIFHHPAAQPAAHPAAQAAPRAAAGQAQPAAPAEPRSAAQPAPQVEAHPQQPVDVESVLTAMAQGKGGGGNWRSSIVDLLKLLDLDSSLQARKDLADELNVHVAADGSADENIALHRAVMEKLAQNGGKVPDALRRA
jgi:hypothetical protein